MIPNPPALLPRVSTLLSACSRLHCEHPASIFFLKLCSDERHSTCIFPYLWTAGGAVAGSQVRYIVVCGLMYTGKLSLNCAASNTIPINQAHTTEHLKLSNSN